MRRQWRILLVLGALGCSAARVDPVTEPLQVRIGAAEETRALDLLQGVLWLQTAAEARASAMQTYNSARLALDRALADPQWTAALEQKGDLTGLRPAVILDIDETVLDNTAFEARLVRSGGAYTPERWAAWVEEQNAPAIPGALDFVRYAESKGVRVFYLSNRTVEEEPATRRNLQRAGFLLEESLDTVLTKGEDGAPSEKAGRREKIAANHRILLMIGDDLGDFLPGVKTTVEKRAALANSQASWWGTRWFVVSNPMYGSWERTITGEGEISPELRIERKIQALDSRQP